MRQKLVVGIKHFPGHAIRTAKVAAIRDRDAQVAQSPPARVGKRARVHRVRERRNGQGADRRNRDYADGVSRCHAYRIAEMLLGSWEHASILTAV